MSGQSFQNHAHRPIHTSVVWFLATVALVLIVRQSGWQLRDWATLLTIFAVFELGWISRAYTVKLQDRIIMLEEKVRAAELLPAGQDAQLRKLSSKQIAALRFASDDEFGALLERAVRENLPPKEIKAAVRTWRPDPHRT